MKFPSSTLLLLVATCHDVAVQSFTISSFLPSRIINGGRATSAEPSSSSSYGDSLLLKASEKESGENFQRRLLATRLKQNIRDNTKLRSGDNDNDGGNNTANTSVLLEDTDGLGVALLDKNNIQDDVVVVEETQEPLLKYEEEEEVVESVSVKDVVLLMEEVEEVSNKNIILLDGTVADEDYINDLMMNIEVESEKITQELIEEECEINDKTGGAMDSLCEDEEEMKGFRAKFKLTVGKTIQVVRGVPECEEGSLDPCEESMVFRFRSKLKNIFRRTPKEKFDDDGDSLEAGWSDRGNSSAIRRNAEIWKFGLKCVFRVLKPRSMRTKGASDEEVEQAQIEAATYIRDGLLTLGPTFVKLGQVISTRTDVLPKTYTDVLNSLQDDVPAFSGARAKEIVSEELGVPVDEMFTDFSGIPLKAASLGQVHTAYYKGKKVAIKVQRAGLKELFDVDLKNLRKLAVLLDKFDPKSDGADRDWVSIYEESERLLYLEIDYINEANNGERFAKDFKDIDYVRVPEFYRDISTPRVLVMEFIESLKLTDIKKIDSLGLDRNVLAQRTADAFLRQIVETSYFHCDPHPGNLCVDDKGNLVYYDFGMMDELKPNVREGFRKFCTALFAGGPMISDRTLAKNAKLLVDGVEEAGVLAKGSDRLAVEKLARFFMRSFKNNQLGKSSDNIKQTLGTDLQTLTSSNSFRFPSTFTFIFRAFASVEGIGKGLDEGFEIGKLAQPFIEKFTDSQQYDNEIQKKFSIFQKATGLNSKDVEIAVTSPRKIAYIEETLRAMEDGSLKIRTRSLENEKSLERMVLTQSRSENILIATAFLNVAGFASKRLLEGAGYAGFSFFVFQALMANVKVKKFDKTQAKFVQTKFNGLDEDDK